MERKYRYKDIDMLMGTRIVAENFKTDKTQFILVNPVWADPFITNFENRINHAMSHHLGIDQKSMQKLATANIYTLVKETADKLALIKTLLGIHYEQDKKRLKWILDTLGFSRHLTKAQKNDQEGIVQFLMQFKENMTPELKTEIQDKGAAPELIDTIIQNAEILREADIIQEKCKGDSKTLTEEAVKEFNAIYKTAIGLCKIGQKLFKTDKNKKQQYSFQKIINTMNFHKNNNNEEENENEQ